MASLLLSHQRSHHNNSSKRHDAPRSVLSDAANKANQLKIQAAIGAYKEMAVDHDEQVPRNFVKGILEGFGINRNKFYYELKKHQASNIEDGVATIENSSTSVQSSSSQESIEDVTLSNDSRDNNAERNKGGRPQGSSNHAKEQHQERKEKAISWAVERLKMIVKDPAMVDASGKWRRGVLTDLAREAREKFHVDERELVKADTIRKRFDRDKPRDKSFQAGYGPASPLKDIEPIFLATCIAMQRILLPLDQKSFLNFVNSFIQDTEWEKKVLEFKEKNLKYKLPMGVMGREGLANLGTAYFRGFMKRHSKTLRSKKPHNFTKERKKTGQRMTT
jgi:hypothetical protein